jgi:hypothetical protein
VRGNRPAFLGAAFLLATCAQARRQAPGPVDDTLDLLPDPAGIQGLRPTGDPQRAAGQQLFELIDGGAELFLAHGFEKAIAQEYESPDGSRFSVEIFLMNDAAGARRVYAERGGTTADGPSIGDASTFEDYYGHYVAGRLYFTVTASRTSGDLRPPIERLARAVVERLPPGE